MENPISLDRVPNKYFEKNIQNLLIEPFNLIYNSEKISDQFNRIDSIPTFKTELWRGREPADDTEKRSTHRRLSYKSIMKNFISKLTFPAEIIYSKVVINSIYTNFDQFFL